jgi:hypothetical protein
MALTLCKIVGVSSPDRRGRDGGRYREKRAGARRWTNSPARDSPGRFLGAARTKTHMPSRHAAFGAKFTGGNGAVKSNARLTGRNVGSGGGEITSAPSKR